MQKHNPRAAALMELVKELDDEDVAATLPQPEPEPEESEPAEAEVEISADELTPEKLAQLQELLAQLGE